MASYPSVPSLRRKKPRGFICQVYLALKSNLCGYRGKAVYHRVDAIISRAATTNKRIDDLLKRRRRVDIIRLALKLMDEHVFKDDNIAFELYPQLDPDNDQFDDFDEDGSDEEYIVPHNKAEPTRKPFDLAVVKENIKPARNTKISQKFVQPLSVRSKMALITTPTSIVVATALPELNRVHADANENRPPVDAFKSLTIDDVDHVDLKVLPPRTQATVINRLVWIMQMACFEFLGYHKESLLINENIEYADSTTLRYYAVLIHSIVNELPVDAMTEPYLAGHDKRNKVDHLLFPLLQLQAEMNSINKVTLETLKAYYDILEPLCKALKSRRGKRIKNLEEITDMLFERRAEDHYEAHVRAERVLTGKIKPARKAAEKEPSRQKRTIRFAQIRAEEKAILAELADELKAIEQRYEFDSHEPMFIFFDKVDDSSISLNRRAVNTHTIEGEESWDAAADSD
ncbi:hypothetical protein TWF696_008691 [Orbilia brochopaga]|uniref:Uncharacterized protein n=1 Tax=Orbilia brochopaga TaxID=3140254 RepID=A0AAV9UKI4_9PEZI